MSNKNQHFVSQTYLRGFGVALPEGERKAINLHATRARKVVEGAWIKQQRSSDYFYGRDQWWRLEAARAPALSPFEVDFGSLDAFEAFVRDGIDQGIYDRTDMLVVILSVQRWHTNMGR